MYVHVFPSGPHSKRFLILRKCHYSYIYNNFIKYVIKISYCLLFSGLPNPSEWYLTKSHGLQVLMSGKSKVNHDTHTSILVHPYVAVVSQTHAERVFVSIIHYIHTTTLGFALYNDEGLACWTDILHACIEQGEGSWWSQHTGVLHMSSVHL